MRLAPHPSGLPFPVPSLNLFCRRKKRGAPNPLMASLSKHGGVDSHHNKSVAVVGAGVSGLAAAYRLKSCGLNVTVFEAEDKAGGSIRSASHNGLIWDEGANTMTESEAEVGMLIDKLGLWEKQQIPVSQNKRYIVKNGTPELIPSNIISFLKSNFLSAQSKLRMLLEPMQSSSLPEDSSEDVNESVGDFFQRRFGKEVVDYLVDPFVAGTSGGDPESLSARHSFPDIWHLEKNFGSIIGGFVQTKLFHKNEEKQSQKMPNRRARLRGSFSFYDGMQTLTDKLYEDLGVDNVKLSSKVLSLSYSHDGKSSLQNWSVAYAPNNRSKRSAVKQPFDAVIMTAPLCKLKEMRVTKGGKHFSFDFLPRVTYLPMSVIVTSFKKEDVKRPLEGFGVLVPSKEQENGFRTLGTLFSSMMFPDRAPDDQYLYTTFIGGSRNRDSAGTSTDKLMPLVKSDLKRLLGVEGEPTFVKHVYWANAFPLYGRDYDSVLEAIDTLEQELPGFYYAGNHRGGLSVGKAITSGLKAADLVNSYLNSSSEKMPADDAGVVL